MNYELSTDRELIYIIRFRRNIFSKHKDTKIISLWLCDFVFINNKN